MINSNKLPRFSWSTFSQCIYVSKDACGIRVSCQMVAWYFWPPWIHNSRREIHMPYLIFFFSSFDVFIDVLVYSNSTALRLWASVRPCAIPDTWLWSGKVLEWEEQWKFSEHSADHKDHGLAIIGERSVIIGFAQEPHNQCRTELLGGYLEIQTQGKQLTDNTLHFISSGNLVNWKEEKENLIYSTFQY